MTQTAWQPTQEDIARREQNKRRSRARLAINDKPCDACGVVGYYGAFHHIEKGGHQFKADCLACHATNSVIA